VPVQLTSPSGVAGPGAFPAKYLMMYDGYPRSGCGAGGRALLYSFLGPAESFPTCGEIVGLPLARTHVTEEAAAANGRRFGRSDHSNAPLTNGRRAWQR
jgi:hypothetical protein